MKILIVCDQFPPAFGPRMGYLCKYLVREGIRADVVCERHPDTRFAFLSGYADHVENVSFYRYENGWKHFAEWGITMLADLLFRYKDRRMVRAFLKNGRMRGYDLVIASSYKLFPLKAGWDLARHFRIPLVADLRDIIEQFPDKSYLNRRILPGTRIGEILENRITTRMIRRRNRILEKAMYVVSVSPWHVDFLKRTNPRTVLIYNGYDPELFFPNPVPDPFFRVTFTGRILSLENRDPGMLFQAVSELAREGSIEPETFRLDWYVDKESRTILEKEARKYGVGDFMHYAGFVAAESVPEILNRSSVLLQLANRSDESGPKGVMTTKFFEALAVGKPLLLVRSDESYLEKTIERFHCGLAARQAGEVSAFLREQFRIWKRQGFTQVPVSPEIEAEFSRKGQAALYSGLFRKAVRDFADSKPLS